MSQSPSNSNRTNSSRWTNSKARSSDKSKTFKGLAKDPSKDSSEKGWQSQSRGRSSGRGSNRGSNRGGRSYNNRHSDRSNERSPPVKPSKPPKEVPVLTLPKIDNPVYANLVKKVLPIDPPSPRSPRKVFTPRPEPKAVNDYPRLRRIIQAQKKTRQTILYRDIRNWAKAWTEELKFIHSTFVPDLCYSDFVEIAYSLTPNSLNRRGYQYPSKVRPDETYVVDSYFTLCTPSHRLNKIRQWCHYKFLPLFACNASVDVARIFDTGDEESIDNFFPVTPREDEGEDEDYEDIVFE